MPLKAFTVLWQTTHWRINDFPLNYKSLGWEDRQCECRTINSIYSTASGAKEQLLVVRTDPRLSLTQRSFGYQ